MAYQSFEDFLHDYEDDIVGVPVHAGTPEMEHAYKLWVNTNKADRSESAKMAAATRAKNDKNGISQKNLTGSTKQKQWAAEIRGKMLAGFSEENQKFLLEQSVSAKFWIENRNWVARDLSAKLDAIGAARIQAEAAVNLHRRKHAREDGSVVITPEFDRLRNASQKARLAFDQFMEGN
jgi:hypothetical protein